MNVLLIPFWILALSTSGFAATQVFSLAELQKRALENSNLIRSKLAHVQAEEALAQQSGVYSNPSLNIQGGTMKSGGSSGPLLDVTLGQTIPFPGKKSLMERINELKTHIADSDHQQTRLLVQHAVTLSALRLAVLRELSKHSLERQSRFKLILGYLKSHPQASPSQKIESGLIENQIRILEKGILELNQDRLIAMSELGFFVQMETPPEVQFEWISRARLPVKSELEKQIFGASYLWKKKEKEVEAAAVELKLAKLSYLPDFGLAVNYRQERVLPPNHFYSGGLTVSIPLWDHGQHVVPAAQAKLVSEESAQSFARSQLSQELEEAWIRVNSTQQVLELFPLKLVLDSEKKFEQAETEFKRGRIGTAVFLQTDAQIHETLDTIYQTQIQLVQNLRRLLLLASRPLEW